MESECFQEYKSLVSEVTKGMEQVKQLRASSSSNQERILERMLASYEEALLILNRSAPEGQHQSVISSSSEGQRQSVISSLSEGQHQSVISSSSDPPVSSMSECKVTQSEDSSRGSWKRKSLPRWTEQVSVRPGLLSGSLDDGYSWRKYGQKEILGSKYPRGYYRCVNRSNQGCLATKQVQRSDDDPSIFEITYRGAHTCLGIAPVGPKQE